MKPPKDLHGGLSVSWPSSSATAKRAVLSTTKEKRSTLAEPEKSDKISVMNFVPRLDGGGDSINLGEFSEVKVPPPPLAFDKARKTSTSVSYLAEDLAKIKTRQLNLKQFAQTSFPTQLLKSPTLLAGGTTQQYVLDEKKSTSDDKVMEKIDPVVDKLYTLSRRLGKGAYGVVWEAMEKRSGRKVALKKIFEAFRNTTDSQRTYREVVFLKAFGHHPNIISIIGGHPAVNSLDLYIVFPLMKFDLYKIIERNPERLTETSTRRVAYQLTLALNYLHSAQIIHRDLKPANILLDERLNVKLADLGLARSLPADFELDLTGQTDGDPQLTDYVATRWYRPPEIIVSSRVYSKFMDMWAFGCILGEMLLKRVLFAGESTSHQLQLIMTTIITPDNNEIEDLCKFVDHQNVDIIKSFIKQRGPSIADIFQNFDCSTVDIIERLLHFSPAHRLTVEEVLNHPYMQNVRDTSKEMRAPGPFHPPLNDCLKLDIVDYQNALYSMIDRKEMISDLNPFGVGLNNFSSSYASLSHLKSKYYPHQADDDEFVDSTTDTDGEEDLLKTIRSENEGHPTEEPFANFDNDTDTVDGYTNFRTEPADNNLLDSSHGHGVYHLDLELQNQYENLDVSSIPVPSSFRQAPNVSPRTSSSSSSAGEQFSTWTTPSIPATKSVSDSTTLLTNTSPSEAKRYGGSKNISILTMPSGKREDGGDDDEKPEAFKKFELLCQKHDVSVEEYGDLCWKTDNVKTPLKVDMRNTVKKFEQSREVSISGESQYDYLPQSMFQKAVTSNPMTSLPNRKGNVNPPPSRSGFEGQGQGDTFGDNFDTCDYTEDFTRIKNTMARKTGAGEATDAFVNPYKPKGLKTFAASSTYDNDNAGVEDDDWETSQADDFFQQWGPKTDLRYSKSLPQVNNNRNANTRQTKVLDKLPGIGEFRPNSNSLTSFTNKEKLATRKTSNLLALKGSTTFTNESVGGSNRLTGFESKGTRVTLSQSQDSIYKSNVVNNNKTNKTLNGHSTEEIVLTNGRKKVRNPEGIKDTAKVKFAFNPYARVEEGPVEPQPRRPFGGRSYNKGFQGPSFKKNADQRQPHSFSDTEVAVANSSHVGYNAYARLPSQGGHRSHGRSSSAYFPGIPSQRPVLKGPYQNTTTPSINKNGFESVQMASASNFGNHQQRFSRPRHILNKTGTHYGGHSSLKNPTSTIGDFDKPDSSTIRASELFKLRNSLPLGPKGSGTGRKYL